MRNGTRGGDLRASLAAAAHTQKAVQKLQIAETPEIKNPLIQLPAPQEEARDLLPESIVIASFGFATYAMRISTLLDCVAAILPEHPNVRCVIVGTVLFVGGLVGEMIAAQRAEVRELRRRLDEVER